VARKGSWGRHRCIYEFKRAIGLEGLHTWTPLAVNVVYRGGDGGRCGGGISSVSSFPFVGRFDIGKVVGRIIFVYVL
jgi:hypothetical protein